MQILYGTGNQAKLSVMRKKLAALGIEVIGLNDVKAQGKRIPEVMENGSTPLENARLKAMAYVNGKYLSDLEMEDYYTGLAKKYGNLVAEYRNGICFVMDKEHIYESMEQTMYSEKFIITDSPHSEVRKEGFPLDSISIDMKTGKYYYDLADDTLEQLAVEEGFLEFFQKQRR